MGNLVVYIIAGVTLVFSITINLFIVLYHKEDIRIKLLAQQIKNEKEHLDMWNSLKTVQTHILSILKKITKEK